MSQHTTPKPVLPPAARFDAHLDPFPVRGCTVLITGGSSGIGLGLVHEFIQAGAAQVIITGRREEELKKAQAKYPSIHYFVSDASRPAEREELAAEVGEKYPSLNLLINNAGIQRNSANVANDEETWSQRQVELDVNMSAPVHYVSLFRDLLNRQPKAAIINVTSGLAFIPAVFCPVYSATKAFLHSFTLSLRVIFSKSNVRVCELIPPAVKTNLGGSHDFGEEVDVFCKHVFEEFRNGSLEFGFNMSERARWLTREQQQEGMFGMIANGIRPFSMVESASSTS